MQHPVGITATTNALAEIIRCYYFGIACPNRRGNIQQEAKCSCVVLMNGFTPFTIELKKYILPTFYTEMYKCGSENW